MIETHRITSLEQLRVAIEERRELLEYQELSIRRQVDDLVDRIRPANLVRSVLRSVAQHTDGSQLFNAAIGILSGYLSRRLLFRSRGPLSRLLGSAFQVTMTNVMTRKAGAIRLGGVHLLQRILGGNHHAEEV
jgi:hypothetical protein